MDQSNRWKICQVSRLTPTKPVDSHAEPADGTKQIEKILALDGMGSIVIRPCDEAQAPANQPTGQHQQTAQAARAQEPTASLNHELTDREAQTGQDTAAPSPTAAMREAGEDGAAAALAASTRTPLPQPTPAGETQPLSQRLQAALERSKDQQFVAQEVGARNATNATDDAHEAPKNWREDQGQSPVRRIVEPVLVEPQAAAKPQPGSQHIKLTELADPAPATKPVQPQHQQSGAPSEAPTSAPTSAGSTDAHQQPSDSLLGASADPLRHLPQATRGKLRSFVSSVDNTNPPAPIPAIGNPQDTEKASSAATAKNTGPLGALHSSGGNQELLNALRASKSAFLSAGVFSFVINLLMLTGPLFMLQVYDRVMTSGSIPTLLVLFAITAMLYGTMGLLELARSRIVVRIGVDVDNRIGNRVFQAALTRSLIAPEAAKHALRELDHLRSFLAGPGPLTFFDAPWTPVYLLVIFALHWVLGIAALFGGAILLGIAMVSEFRSRAPLGEASKTASLALELAETGQRNAEVITAMGMLDNYRSKWQQANHHSLAWQVLAADRLGTTSAVSKSLRLLMQSSMLALGAALALDNQISAGSIVAATIIFGRALAPVEQAIGQWRPFIRAREAYGRLTDLLQNAPAPEAKTKLPRPEGRLTVDSLRVAAPDTRQLILANVNFEVAPGQVLAVVGPSASGKSTLARTLVGLWPPFGGSIRLDGARLDQWDAEDLGQYIGYLPQTIELFSGTVKENISRFRADVSDEAIIEAARMAHAHDMITALPQGYDTQLGAFGTYLSGGQRQRLGLARALFGNPVLIVLDEPNANLDRQGDEALDNAIEGMRQRGQTVILVSHRLGAISKADLMLYVDRGIQRAFGSRADVLKKLRGGENHPMRRASDAVPSAQNVGTDGATSTTAKENQAPRPAAQLSADQAKATVGAANPTIGQ